MSEHKNIPAEWLQLTAGDIADIVAGGTPKAGDPNNFAVPGTQIPWLTPADLSNYSDKYIAHGARDLSQQGYESSSAKLMPAGSLLFSSRAPIGYVAIATNEISTNQGFKSFVLPSGVNPSYGYYFLRSIRHIAESMGTGTTFKEISGANAKKLPFVLPPLAEQKVIADKLDALLAQVESTKARLDRIPPILKRFRQSVLDAAVSGQLTRGWRNSKEFGHSEGALGKFVSIDIGHAFKSKEFSTDGIALLRGQNIEPGTLRWSDTKFFPEGKLEEFSHLFIQEDDIILAMDRPIISSGLKLARAKAKDLPCVLVQRVTRFKEFEGLVPDYLYILLQDISFINYIQPNQTGSDIPHISGKQILAYPIQLPTVEEQTEIVRRVARLFAYADRIEQQVNNALERVNNLTQSILAKAFRGELTEQWRKENPELISGENSAEALLERIKAERAAMKPARKARRKSAKA
ncbi:restriction endonuclease subunit S [Marinobacterium stanieri]|uniref:restriction endonuclease subunit S n=1 Tax=Marinobacterium stanieri TaxID=49186 RepID=UPI000255806E|nr:restriction endonuclease subunit S [Marinobacterium stanieri]